MEIIVTIPKDTPLKKFQKIRGNVKKRLNGSIKRSIQKEYDKTVVGWGTKPNFEGKVTEPRGEIWLTVRPKGKGTLNWIRVDQGTKTRSITSKSPNKPMVFPRFYRPRTTPGGAWGKSPLRHGPIVHTHLVKNHRIEPRKFSEKILERLEGKIQSELTSTIRKSV